MQMLADSCGCDFDTLLGLPASILDQPVDVTRFPTIAASIKTERRMSLRQLADEVEGASAESKEELPWFKLARFGNQRTVKGSLRHNANVIAVSGVEADYDAGEMSLAEAERRLRDAHIGAMLYTTAKHTMEAPRWRVFAPFASSREPESRIRFMERLNGVLDGMLDGASFTLSQSYYGGSVSGRPPISVRLVDGRPIDLADDLDAVALSKGKRRQNDQELRQGDGSGSAALFALAASIKRQRGTVDELKAALSLPENVAASAHVAKEEKAGKGRGERAIVRAWDNTRSPPSVDDLYDLDGAPSSPLRFLSPGQCADAPTRGYVIKGFLAPGDVACIFGAPGAGKSLISPHFGYAAAQGRTAFGMRTKPGRVSMSLPKIRTVCGAGFRRLSGRHGDAESFSLVEGVSDLLADESADMKALYAAVQEKKPALIFIDTLAMSFPGLEENSAEHMGRVVAIARKLASHAAAVVLIHHDTKAGTPTPRGHSLLNGALDVALQLTSKDETGIVRGRLTKNRNGSCDRDIAFRIATACMGEDEDGDPITFALVDELAPGSATLRPKLSNSERAALKILSDMLGVSGNRSVSESDWRVACIEGRSVSASDEMDSRKKATTRAVKGLAQKQAIIIRDGSAMVPDNLNNSSSGAGLDRGTVDDLEP